MFVRHLINKQPCFSSLSILEIWPQPPSAKQQSSSLAFWQHLFQPWISTKVNSATFYTKASNAFYLLCWFSHPRTKQFNYCMLSIYIFNHLKHYIRSLLCKEITCFPTARLILRDSASKILHLRIMFDFKSRLIHICIHIYIHKMGTPCPVGKWNIVKSLHFKNENYTRWVGGGLYAYL